MLAQQQPAQPTLDISKPVRTRCGWPARLICVDRDDRAFPVVALYNDGSGEALLMTTELGFFSDVEPGAEMNQWPDGNPLDLINVPESEACYPVNPLFQLLGDPTEAEFSQVVRGVAMAMSQTTKELTDNDVATAIMFGMMQQVRARADLPLTFSAAVGDLVRQRTAANIVARLVSVIETAQRSGILEVLGDAEKQELDEVIKTARAVGVIPTDAPAADTTPVLDHAQ